MTAELVGRERFFPVADQAHGFLADFDGQRLVRSDRKNAGSVLHRADAVGVVYQAAKHEGRPFAAAQIIQQRGGQRAHIRHIEILYRAYHFILHFGVGIVDKTCDLDVFHAAQSDDGGEAHGGGGIVGKDADLPRVRGHVLQRVDPGVAQK